MKTGTKEMNKREMTLNELEQAAGGVEHAYTGGKSGGIIEWIINLFFGD